MLYSGLFKILEREKKYEKVFIRESGCNDEICSICLENDEDKYNNCFIIIPKSVKLIKCGHTFHENCIRKFLEVNFYHNYISCPLCREIYVL